MAPRSQSLPRRLAPLLLAGLVLACRGEPVGGQQRAVAIERIVDSLRPAVERAAGMRFRTPPRSAMRSREQAASYLAAKLDEELPTPRAEGLEAAYRLFGLLPDSVRLRPLLLDLLTEQVVGFYDADSLTLFGVAGGDPSQLRLVLAHEMVHALQGQYLPLDSLLNDRTSNDRSTARQAVLEGQATLASLRVLAPGQDVATNPDFWEAYRDQVRAAQTAMPKLAAAPLVVREGLIFPYIEGAAFMRWYGQRHPDSLPYGARMPVSTEQVLHPERYARGDRPVPLRFAGDSTDVIHEDVLGELEIKVLRAELAAPDHLMPPGALGWGADRYRVVRTAAGGPAIVWYTVWDDVPARDRFLNDTGRLLRGRRRAGYRSEVTSVDVDGRAGVRWVFAPAGWAGWGRVPGVEIGGGAGVGG